MRRYDDKLRYPGGRAQPFTKAEDELILRMAEETGANNFTIIARNLKDRSVHHVRERYRTLKRQGAKTKYQRKSLEDLEKARQGVERYKAHTDLTRKLQAEVFPEKSLQDIEILIKALHYRIRKEMVKADGQAGGTTKPASNLSATDGGGAGKRGKWSLHR